MTRPPKIDAYDFGRIEIDGQTYTSDVVILPAGVQSGWWREEGHVLKPGDVCAVLEAAPEVLVIGQGASGCMCVADETLACLKQSGIEAICALTGRAVHIYNERRERGAGVAAALHLTC
jgi:hypothetical protein